MSYKSGKILTFGVGLIAGAFLAYMCCKPKKGARSADWRTSSNPSLSPSAASESIEQAEKSNIKAFGRSKV